MEKPVQQNSQYTILAVDDAKDSLMLLEFDLADHGYQVLTAESGENALNLVQDMEADIILLDMHMPGMSGLMTLQTLKSEQATQNIPVIMLSASDDESAIVSALELGADDYVTKPYIPNVLLARIRNSLRFMEKTKQLEYLAKTDSLTKVNNRRSFQELASASISQAKRTGGEIAMVMLDLDHFKRINDKYGHEAGDKALVEFAAILTDTFRDYDIIARIGGEEFAVCMPNTLIDDAYLACERCRTILESHVVHLESEGKQISFSLTVSIGITGGSGSAMAFDNLLRHADAALYQAKEQGRNRSVIDQDAAKMQTEQAIDANQLLVEGSDTNEGPSQDKSGDFPGIDYQIGVNNVLGDDSLFAEILLMFYQDHGADGDTLIESINTDDHDTLKSTIHTLKGVACSIGAMTLFEYCKELDHAVNNTETEKYQPLVAPVAAELSKVLGGIKTKLV